MNAIFEFLATNAAFLISVVALLISLRANYTAHRVYQLNVKSKVDADRLLLFEKKRELLNEVDRQNTKFATLMMLTSKKLLLFRENPELHGSMQQEFDRLTSNLAALLKLDSRYDEQRSGIESIDVFADIATQEELLANIRLLTIHLEKDIAHEQSQLEEMRLMHA